MKREVSKKQKDHLIPACIIGNFSNYRNSPGGGRNNKVTVKIKGKDKNFEMKAENILYAKGAYDSVIDDLFGKRVTDGLWDEYESELPKLVDTFESKSHLSQEMYINTLVPYVASLFVRDTGYEQWINSQMNGPIGAEATPETVQFNRGVFYSDTKSDVLVYSLDILMDENGGFILPDRGVSFLDASLDYWREDKKVVHEDKSLNGSRVWLTHENGCLTPPSYLIPLSSKVVVKLTPREFLYGSPTGINIPVRYIDVTNKILDIHIDHVNINKNAVEYINEGLAQGARRAMIGSDGKMLDRINFFDISDKYFIENILGMTALIREKIKYAASDILKFYKNPKKYDKKIVKDDKFLLRILNVGPYIKPSDITLKSYDAKNLYSLIKYQNFTYDMKI